MWLFFMCINRCFVSIHSASQYWLSVLFLQLLEARRCARWGWCGHLEVRHHRSDVRWSSTTSQELTELCPTLQSSLEATPKYRATHHRRFQSGSNSERAPLVTYSSEDENRHWASNMLCVQMIYALYIGLYGFVFVLIKHSLNKQHVPGKFSFPL